MEQPYWVNRGTGANPTNMKSPLPMEVKKYGLLQRISYKNNFLNK